MPDDARRTGKAAGPRTGVKKPVGKEAVKAPKLRYVVVVSVRHSKHGQGFAQAVIEVDEPLDRWSRIEPAQMMARKIVAIIRNWKVEDILDLFFVNWVAIVRED